MYNLFAQFPRQQICRDRQYSGLLRWSAFIGASALPPPPAQPSEQDVKNHIVAERIPAAVDSYVQSTLALTVADPGIQTNIRQHLNGFNDEATEVAMDAQVDAALGAAMPRYADAIITQTEVDRWLQENGYTTP